MPLFDPIVPFPGGTFRAVILRAVDGDTVRCLVDCGFSVTRTLDVRLAGINAPELHGGTPETRARAAAAQTFVAQYEGRTVVLTTQQTKSFDRYVGVLTIDGVSLTALIVAAGLADVWWPT